MSGTYRYLIADVLTSAVNLEPNCFGVSYARRISKPASATFSIVLDSDIRSQKNRDIIEWTQSGKSALWIERDNKIIWGGIVWSDVYQSQAAVMSYTAQTFESFFYKQFIEEDLEWEETDQRIILCELIEHMQGKTNADIGIIIPDPGDFDPGDAVIRDEYFPAADGWSYGKAIEYLTNYADGFEYTIEVGYDADGNLAKTLNVDNKIGVPETAELQVFDYPGNVKNYYFPRTVSDAGVSVIGLGESDLTFKYVHTDLLAEGWPDYQQQFSNRDVSEEETLESQTEAEANRVRPPITVPTLELEPSLEPSVDQVGMGDYAKTHIEDLRFPDGKVFTTRIIGWDAKPSEADNQEYLKLVVSGEEVIV